MRLGVRAPLCSLTGYAEWGREIVLGLHNAGVKVKLELLDKPLLDTSRSSLSEEFVDLIEELEDDIPDNGIVLNLCTPPQFNFDLGRYKVGLGLFEAFSVPQSWLVAMNRMDLIITLSEFNKNVFSKCGLRSEKIVLVPPAVDCKRFHPDVRPPYVEHVRPFTILFVGQLILRKGWDKLLLAALRSFRTHDDVCVILKLPPIRMAMEKRAIISKLQEIKNLAGASNVPIYFNCNPITTGALPRIYQLARKTIPDMIYHNIDYTNLRGVFALPSLGEGIGLPYLESMASGLLTLGTVSTSQEFLNPSNAIVVDSGSPVRNITLELEHSLYRGTPFPNVTVDSVSDSLQRAYNLSAEDRFKLEENALKTVQELTYSNCVDHLINALTRCL